MIAPFAILELERDPLRLADLPAMTWDWLQSAGGFAAIGLAVYVIALLFSDHFVFRSEKGINRLVLIFAGLSLACYLVAAGFLPYEPPTPSTINPNSAIPLKLPPPEPSVARDWRERMTALGGLFAILGLGIPFLRDALRLSVRRIFAIMRLTIKEAIRRKILWVFLAFLIVFLFPPTWFRRVKPEDEVREFVGVIDFWMSTLMIFAFSLLAAFAIPTDMKNQTIHTIVTKPVEKFEIVLGRFFGFTLLAVAVLIVLSTVASLMILASGVSAESKFESLRARTPVYGGLEFRNVRGKFDGESVGREWEYRRYVAGGERSSQRAVFMFTELPNHLGSMTAVPVEFSFDIFRTTKGEEENRGIQSTLSFATAMWDDPEVQKQYEQAIKGVTLYAQPGHPDWAKLDEIAEKYGFYKFPSKEIVDYHTFAIQVPPGIFRNALKTGPAKGSTTGLKEGSILEITVKNDSKTQFLGAAKRDLYIVAGNGSFVFNFIKGALGPGLKLCLLLGLATTCSTVMSGVISWLTSMVIFGFGIFRDSIKELADGQTVGGGPGESLVRLMKNTNLTAPLDETPTTKIAYAWDQFFQWFLNRVLNLIPDVNRFDWSNYVSEGFAISNGDVLMNVIMLFGYLLPWAVLAYFLIKSREIAS